MFVKEGKCLAGLRVLQRSFRCRPAGGGNAPFCCLPAANNIQKKTNPLLAQSCCFTRSDKPNLHTVTARFATEPNRTEPSAT